MRAGKRLPGVIFAAVVAVALIAAPTPASAAKFNCPAKVKRYAYKVTAAGHNGGVTTYDGDFSNFSYVDFSSTYEAVLRVCEPIGAIRMNRAETSRASATHEGAYVRERKPDGTEVRCSWDETLRFGGPLKVTGYDFARAQGYNTSGWAIVLAQGVGFGDRPTADTYRRVLEDEHRAACGEQVPMVSTLGPDSWEFGALTAASPDFVWPGVVIEGNGRRNPPPVLGKLLNGRDTKLVGRVDYPDHPTGSYVEHGDWLVSLEFKRRRG